MGSARHPRPPHRALRQGLLTGSLLVWSTLALLLITTGAQAQIVKPPFNKSSQWLAYSGDHAVKGKWGLHFDGWWRQMDASTWNQWVVRPGVNYQLSRNVQLSAAYGYFMAHPGGLQWAGGSFPEHRLQQQVTINRPIGKFPLRHRFRADQRFLGSGHRDGIPRSWLHQHRARYMVRSDIPLKKAENERTLLSFGMYNEFFWRFDEQSGSAFDQNRIFAGFTYRPSRTLAVEIGAFNQRFQPMAGGRYENNMVMIVGISNTAPLSQLFGRRKEVAKASASSPR